jgi:glutathione S-transferase
MMTLYEFPPTRSIRARWMLQELGEEFEAVTVNLVAGDNRRTEFLKINPAGRVPVLVDGDLTITESVAIVLYLAERDAQRRFLPEDIALRSQVYRWLMFAATELEQPLWRIARHTALYPEEMRLPAELPIARQDFAEMAAVLGKHMRDREFVVGDEVTAADFVMAYTLDWANEARLLGGFPNLKEYFERMYARPNAPPRIAEAFASIAA